MEYSTQCALLASMEQRQHETLQLPVQFSQQPPGNTNYYCPHFKVSKERAGEMAANMPQGQRARATEQHFRPRLTPPSRPHPLAAPTHGSASL